MSNIFLFLFACRLVRFFLFRLFGCLACFPSLFREVLWLMHRFDRMVGFRQHFVGLVCFLVGRLVIGCWLVGWFVMVGGWLFFV